jgi:hypothetical protein
MSQLGQQSGESLRKSPEAMDGRRLPSSKIPHYADYAHELPQALTAEHVDIVNRNVVPDDLQRAVVASVKRSFVAYLCSAIVIPSRQKPYWRWPTAICLVKPKVGSAYFWKEVLQNGYVHRMLNAGMWHARAGRECAVDR